MSRSGSANDWVCDSPKNELDALANKEELYSMMECPYCLEMPVPPVYLCLTGHLICSSCRVNLKKCGLCASPIAETRNFFYENLFEKISFACKYVAEGCNDIMLGKLLKDHQENCDFRPIPCIKYGCANNKVGKYVAYSKYLDHFKEVHKAKCNNSRSGTVSNEYNADSETWNISRWVHETYQFKGHTFFVNCQVRKPEVGIWLWMLGTVEEAKEFRVRITLGNYNALESGVTTWEGPVHSIRKPYENIMDEGLCLSTSIHAVKALRMDGQFSVPRSYWMVNFHIKEVNTSVGFTFQPVSFQNLFATTPPPGSTSSSSSTTNIDSTVLPELSDELFRSPRLPSGEFLTPPPPRALPPPRNRSFRPVTHRYFTPNN